MIINNIDHACNFRKIMPQFLQAAERAHCDYAGIYRRHAGRDIGMNLTVEDGNSKVFSRSW